MKTALAMNLCVYVPRGLDETAPSGDIAGRFSDSVLLSPSLSSAGQSIHGRPAMPTTPTPSSSGLRLPRSGSKSLKVDASYFIHRACDLPFDLSLFLVHFFFRVSQMQ